MSSLDATPTNAGLYRETATWGDVGTGAVRPPPRPFGETVFIGVRADVPVLRGPLDATATSEEARRSPASRVEPRPGGEGELPGLRDARLALLARKYEGRASVEDTARLQILNERLRRLAPRVTREDVEVVVEMVADAEGIASRLTAMKAKLGLR